MKCIIAKNGKVERVTDSVAESRVKSGDWIFTSKTEWKNQIYGLDDKIRKQFPANVEGSDEFNKANEKARKADKETKKRENREKKISKR